MGGDLRLENFVEPVYKVPKWVYKNSLSFDGDSISKTSAQGWNKAGAYTAALCKSGNCKLTAEVAKQAKTSGHNLHFYLHLSTTTGLADAPRDTMWCSGGGKVYHRWSGQARWPAMAGISIYDPKPFAL